MKFTDPTGNGRIVITQTYHGETHKLPDTQCAIDIRMSANEIFHSATDGVVEGLWQDYISIIPTDSKFRTLYVHTDRHIVKKGQAVKAGQKLGQMAPIANPHLHFGMKWTDMHQPAPRLMDYFDRTLDITTDFIKYPDIAKEWFVDKKLNRSLFQDLQYGPVVPPVDPRIAELENQVANLQVQNSELSNELKLSHEQIVSLVSNAEQSEKEYQELSDRYGTLMIEKKTAVNDKEEAIRILMALKSSKFFWVLELLEKLFPKKK